MSLFVKVCRGLGGIISDSASPSLVVCSVLRIAADLRTRKENNIQVSEATPEVRVLWVERIRCVANRRRA